MAITRLILGLAPWNQLHSIENKILVKSNLKRDTGLQNNRAVLDFFYNLGQIPAFFSFFWLKKG